MLTITLPEHLADSHLLAGVEFVDGSATVTELGSHTRHYFELVGATVEDASTPAADDAEPTQQDPDDAPAPDGDPSPDAEAAAPAKPRRSRKAAPVEEA